MKAVISCQGFPLTDAIASAVEARHAKILDRMDGQPVHAHLEKQHDGVFRVHLEFSSSSYGTFNATAKGQNLYALIKQAADKLIRQMNTASEKQEGKHSRTTLASLGDEDDEAA